jgi:menaquinone-dependent protoporphyrinogen oxidase
MNDVRCVTRRGLLAAAAGIGFGRQVRAAIGAQGDGPAAILFATRYGATRDTAGWIAEGMGGGVTLLDITVALPPAEALRGFAHLLLGSGVWIGGVHSQVRGLGRAHGALLGERLRAVFVVCGTQATSAAREQRLEGYFEQITRDLPAPPPLRAHFGGRMVVEQLGLRDRLALTAFYRATMGKGLEGWDRTEPEEARRLGAALAARSG